MKLSKTILFLFSILLQQSVFAINADSLLSKANTFLPNNYTVPSWTNLQKALTKVNNTKDSLSIAELLVAMEKLSDFNFPYNINTTIYGNPATQLAFTWFTNEEVSDGQVQIYESNSITNQYKEPDITIEADAIKVENLNYNVAANQLLELCGFEDNLKKNYISHKAVAKNLKTNTQYLFRVGKANAWSKTGSFKTAKTTKDPYSFVYITDTQAQNSAMFDITQKTIHAAKKMFPNAQFFLFNGDMVESPGEYNAEWEYEQWFETMQDVWLTTPLVPVLGNHDLSINRNIYHHFHTQTASFDQKMATVPGSVYSFINGDALFIGLSFEDYTNLTYIDSLKQWMKAQVKLFPDIKWRIAFFHKNIYTGGFHQNDADIRYVRENFAPLFDSLKIDLALQGHDHVYEVIGPVKNMKLVADAVSNQIISKPDSISNITGRWGGTFNVNEGTLYFLNSSAGIKKYTPKTKSQMILDDSINGVVNHWELFTGRYGQSGALVGENPHAIAEPMFSYISVSTNNISVKTYAVSSNSGIAYLYDDFKIVKNYLTPNSKNKIHITSELKAFPNPSSGSFNIQIPQSLQNKTIYISSIDGKLLLTRKTLNKSIFSLDLTHFQPGVYILSIGQHCLKLGIN